MRTTVILLLAVLLCTFTAQSQISKEESRGSFKLGVGYVHDFPGLNGYGIVGEYALPLNQWLQGGIGLKRISTSGHPRTAAITEFTKATTVDFNLMFIPVGTEYFDLKIGAGYSFSFFRNMRSYPVYDAASKQMNYVAQAGQGKTSGMSLSGEFEYYFEGNLSAGARVSLTKAYTHVIMGGPFVAVRF